MANPKENCRNCFQTYYQQSLLPLELVDLTFGGQQLTLIGCFVESSSTLSFDCPKVCRTCMELLRTTFVGNEHSLGTNRKAVNPTHPCATCFEFYPANVMMSMQLIVIACNDRSVKLTDCYDELCTRQEAKHGGNEMVCLACVSAIAKAYLSKTVPMITEIKTEPFLTVALPFSNDDCMKIKSEPVEDKSVEVKEEVKSGNSKVTSPKKPTSQRKYECAFCDIKFQKRTDLVHHLEKHHSEKWPAPNISNKYLACPFCRGSLPNKYTLNRHILNSHHSRQIYKCHHCGTFKTMTKSTMRTHLLARHFNIEQKCSHCEAVLPNRRAFIRHNAEHHPTKKFQCPSCKRTFATNQHYRQHMRTQKAVVHCQQCTAVFHSAIALDGHMANFHNKVYVCEICEFPLGKLTTYNTHMLKKHGVHQKPRCGYCGREFDSNEQLNVHQRAEHESLLTQNFICDLCGKRFVLKSSLAAHLRAHRDKVGEKMFKCHLCGKMLLHAKNLESHINVKHLKIRKRPQKIEYKCPKCPQWKFPGRQALGGHMIVHNTENRPFFQCLKCGMAYTRRHKYDIHVTKCPSQQNLVATSK